MKKRILLLTLLALSPFCRAESTGSSAPEATIVILPDVFSEADAKKSSLEGETDQEWESIRSEKIADVTEMGVPESSKFDDLFSVVSYDFATIIQIKTPTIETILERKVLAERYLKRLTALAHRMPHRFSNVILAGLGRGVDIGQTMMDVSASNEESLNNWTKNIHHLISVGDQKGLIKFFNIIGDGSKLISDKAMKTQKAMALAIGTLDLNIHTITKGLENLRRSLKPGEMIDKKRISKLYSYYMLSILGFMEELAKIQGLSTGQVASKVAAMTSEIIQDPTFQAKVLNFIQLWMVRPDEDMALFLAKDLVTPALAEKISNLNDLFSQGSAYKELPALGKIYFHAIKNAVTSNSQQLSQSVSISTIEQDPSLFLNNLNSRLVDFGTTVSQINKGLLEMGDALTNQMNSSLHVEFENPNSPKLDKDLFTKILNAASASTARQVESSL
ncbi:MAG: hypothetical protein ACXVCY_06560 [Pseudobdellovibrionaceae bacterium]